jgi:hypothetical protein
MQNFREDRIQAKRGHTWESDKELKHFREDRRDAELQRRQKKGQKRTH